MRKIDIFNHIWPEPFYQQVQQFATTYTDMNRRVVEVPMITDLEVRRPSLESTYLAMVADETLPTSPEVVR